MYVLRLPVCQCARSTLRFTLKAARIGALSDVVLRKVLGAQTHERAPFLPYTTKLWGYAPVGGLRPKTDLTIMNSKLDTEVLRSSADLKPVAADLKAVAAELKAELTIQNNRLAALENKLDVFLQDLYDERVCPEGVPRVKRR
jgi:hypothetical protein